MFEVGPLTTTRILEVQEVRAKTWIYLLSNGQTRTPECISRISTVLTIFYDIDLVAKTGEVQEYDYVQ